MAHAETFYGRWTMNLNSIAPVPAGPKIESLTFPSGDRRNTEFVQAPSFHQTFGYLGYGMLFALLVSICWTSWLIITCLWPNEAANWLMDTADFDDGRFWMFTLPDTSLVVISVAGLAIIDILYCYVLFKLLTWRRRLKTTTGLPIYLQRDFILKKTCQVLHLSRWESRIRSTWRELTSYQGRYRRYMNALHKFIDVFLETVALIHYFLLGIPEILAWTYAGLVSLNAMVFALMIITAHRRTAFDEVFIDGVFDLFITIIFPSFVLVYCYNQFEFDRESLRLRMEVFPKGSFDNMARLVADPHQISIFRARFNSLRTLSFLDCGRQIAMNLSFAQRFKRVTDILMDRFREARKGKALDKSQNAASIPAPKLLPRYVAFIFFSIAAVIIASSYVSITESQKACSAYPECVMFAYRLSNHTEFCPCLVIVDGDPAPKTYDEWMYPKDFTKTLQALSRTGDLRVIQLINRYLLEWPEELAKCTSLERLSLFYTGVEEIPSWAKRFTQLEYLHIEGCVIDYNLISMPEDMFEGMNKLQLIHLGGHFDLPVIPSLDGVMNLRELILAINYNVKYLPTFASLSKLERLYLIAMSGLESLPDLSPLTNLVNFVMNNNNQVCCNGFVGQCQPSHPFCAYTYESDPCLSEDAPRATEGTLAVLDRFNAKQCVSLESQGESMLRKEAVDACGGVMYRQCFPTKLGYVGSEGGEEEVGICHNTRMMVISCSMNQNVIRFRRLEIERGIGKPCDVSEEAWLGCANKSVDYSQDH